MWRRIVPTHYSDNFFSLLPGESRTVKMECDLPVENVSVEAWNVPRSAKRKRVVRKAK